VGFSGENEIAMREIVDRLGEASLITKATLMAPPSDQVTDGTPPVAPSSLYLRMSAAYVGDEVEQMRAYWQSAMMLSAFWRSMRSRDPDHAVWGGDLEFQAGEESRTLPGLSGYIFQPDAGDYLFMNGEGKPADLHADPVALEREARQLAESHGLAVDRLRATGAAGTALEIDATAANPVEFLTKWHSGMADPVRDPSNLEGVFLVVRDKEGDVVLLRSFSTGLRRSAGGVGEKYTGWNSDGPETTQTNEG
jgi:hypothetical protein